MLLHFTRVILITILALLICSAVRKNGQWQKPSLTSLLLAVLVLPFLLLPSVSAYAEFPDQGLLKTLKQKLL